MGRRSAWMFACLAIVGCDPRAPEPIVTRETGTTEPIEPAKTATKPNTPVRKRPLPPRCIKPTPDEPERVVTGQVPAAGCPTDPGPPRNLVRKRLEIRGSSKGLLTIDAEIAAEDGDRQQGLMYRTSLGENDGMFFMFEIERELTFWMRNTCLPLDMIFIAADGTIVGIEENTPTLTDETFSPGCPARYVLETNAGWTRKNGVKAGMKVKIPSRP